MSPQSSSLGLIGGDFFKHSDSRSGFRSGIYRPEDNAFIRNYAENIDNFYYTGNKFTYPNTTGNPNYLSGIYIRPQLDRIYACGGNSGDLNGALSTDNQISLKYLTENGKISSITSTTAGKKITWITGTFNNTIGWYPEPCGLSFKPDGTQIILCGNLSSSSTFTSTTRGPIFFQYSIPSGDAWDSTKIVGDQDGTFVFLGSTYFTYTGGIGSLFWYPPDKIYGFGYTSGDPRIYDMFVHPDGTTFYYLMGGSNVSTLYQGSISSAWDIGNAGGNLTLNTASLTLDTSVTSGFTGVGYFSGITFNSTGTKLYVISKAYGGTIYQYNLSTPWQISTASFKAFLYVGQFKAEIAGESHGIIMLPDGETIICASLEGFIGRLYEYSVLPY